MGREFVLTPRGAIKNKTDCFYYVPILSSLQALFYCDDITKQVAILMVYTMYTCMLVSEWILYYSNSVLMQ